MARYDWLKATLGAAESGIALVPTEGVVERARARKDDLRIDDAQNRCGDAVSRRAGRDRRSPTRADRTGSRACHRRAAPPGRLRQDGVRYNCRRRAEQRAPARAPRRAKNNRKRSGRAGLRRRLRLILRGPYPDRVGRQGRFQDAGGLRGRSRGARPGDRRGPARSIAFLDRRRGTRRAEPARLRGGVRPRYRSRARDRSARRARASASGGRRRPATTRSVVAGMVFTIEPGAYLPGGAASASKTMSWSPKPASNG